MIKDALSMLRPALKAQNLKAHNLEAQNMRVQDRAPEDMMPETIAPKNRALENQRPVAASAIGFGLATIDAVLGGGLTRGGVHEIYAPSSAHTGAGCESGGSATDPLGPARFSGCGDGLSQCRWLS